MYPTAIELFFDYVPFIISLVDCGGTASTERERERSVAAATRRYLGGKPERREYLRTVKLN